MSSISLLTTLKIKLSQTFLLQILPIVMMLEVPLERLVVTGVKVIKSVFFFPRICLRVSKIPHRDLWS